MEADLRARRVDAVRAWTSFVEHGDGAEQLVRPEIWSSWARSEQTISPEVAYAPLDDEQETAAYFRDSPLQTAVERVEESAELFVHEADARVVGGDGLPLLLSVHPEATGICGALRCLWHVFEIVDRDTT